MKNIFILLLFAQSLVAQTDRIRYAIDHGTTANFGGPILFREESTNTDSIIETWTTTQIVAHSNVLRISPVIDCEYYENFTDWVEVSEGSKPKVLHFTPHEWVYADKYDVNPTSGITNAVYCPCGCPGSQNEARICEICLRHETRVMNWGWAEKKKQESKYVELKNNIKPNSDTIQTVYLKTGPGLGDGAALHSMLVVGSEYWIKISTGSNPSKNSTILEMPDGGFQMALMSPMEGLIGEPFRRDMNKFYITKQGGAFCLKSIGKLSEFEIYQFKVVLK